jgi:hypothetical protein
MSENQACQSQVHVTVLRYLRVKPRRRGLNKQLKAGLRGGGVNWFPQITQSRDQETDSQCDNHEGSSRSDPAHC